MTLSDHKGKQIIGDGIQMCFLRDFRTMTIGLLVVCFFFQKREQAVMIVQQMTIYYGRNSPRFDTVKTFNHEPEKFDYNMLIQDYNSMYLDKPIVVKTKEKDGEKSAESEKKE
jgi:hypothetical protein